MFTLRLHHIYLSVLYNRYCFCLACKETRQCETTFVLCDFCDMRHHAFEDAIHLRLNQKKKNFKLKHTNKWCNIKCILVFINGAFFRWERLVATGFRICFMVSFFLSHNTSGVFKILVFLQFWEGGKTIKKIIRNQLYFVWCHSIIIHG